MNLSITNLSKIYPNGVKALDDVTLEIKPGMFGLLGPNGAGKSSLMRTIATLQRPDSGTITFDQIDVLKNQIDSRKYWATSLKNLESIPNFRLSIYYNILLVLKVFLQVLIAKKSSTVFLK